MDRDFRPYASAQFVLEVIGDYEGFWNRAGPAIDADRGSHSVLSSPAHVVDDGVRLLLERPAGRLRHDHGYGGVTWAKTSRIVQSGKWCPGAEA